MNTCGATLNLCPPDYITFLLFMMMFPNYSSMTQEAIQDIGRKHHLLVIIFKDFLQIVSVYTQKEISGIIVPFKRSKQGLRNIN